MRVSAVLPVYNGEPYLPVSLGSVLAQTYPDVEVVAVDDGSTDRSRDVLARYPARVRLYTQENRGVASARNRGVRESRGEWVAFIDQDDVWYPHKIAKLAEAVRARPELSFVYSDIDIIDNAGNLTGRRGLRSLDIDWIRPFLKGHFHPYPSAVMMRRDLFLEHGGFDERFTLNLHEDVQLWARLCLVADFHFIEEPLIQYRWEHEERRQRLDDRDADQLLRNSLLLNETLLLLHGGNPQMQEPLDVYVRKFESDLRGIIGKRLARKGRFAEARPHFRLAWRQTRNKKSLGRYLRTFLPARCHKVLFPR